VAYLPVATTSAITPRGVTFIPVAGVPPGEVLLAWDAHQPPRHISDLLTAARMERVASAETLRQPGSPAAPAGRQTS
jgi:hypothetical protein